jgi:hypothetical protein
MAPSPSILAAGLVILIAIALGILVRPLLAADMRRTVERANDNTPPDLTAWTIGIVGPGGFAFMLGFAGWMWSNWA